MEILNALLAIPRRFYLPLVFGFIRKLPEQDAELTAHDASIFNCARAFTLAALGSEEYMRRETKPRELATMIVENNSDTNATIVRMQRLVRSPQALAQLQPDFHRLLPLRKIVEDPLFQPKMSSPILPIADACAFVFCRWLTKGRDAEDLMTVMMDRHRPEIDLATHPAGHQYLKIEPGLTPASLAALTALR